MTGSGQANPWRGYIVLSLVWLIVTGAVWFLARRPSPQPVQVFSAPAATFATATASVRTPASPTGIPLTPLPTPAPAPLRVDVAGAVLMPGVYNLPAGSIVADAIFAARGAAPAAALDRLNKAAALVDGVQVYVPRLADTTIPTPLAPIPPPVSVVNTPGVSATSRSGAVAVPPGSPLDLNRASGQELEALPGIGPELAKRIIAGRPYSGVDDLLRVSGIGPETLAKMRPYIDVK